MYMPFGTGVLRVLHSNVLLDDIPLGNGVFIELDIGSLLTLPPAGFGVLCIMIMASVIENLVLLPYQIYLLGASAY